MKLLAAIGKGILLAALLLVAAVVLIPLVIPQPAVKDVRPTSDLADADSKFIEVNGIDIHYKVYPGNPAGTPIILLHGFGASLFSWREAAQPLAAYGDVIAYDRPGFGLTERPGQAEWLDGINPYGFNLQPALLVGLMDQLGIERAVLVGNSAGGTVAVQTALEYPQRVAGLVLVDAAIYTTGGPMPEWAQPFLNTPQANWWGPLFVRNIRNWGVDFLKSAWHDPQKITPQVMEGYTEPLQTENWDRALWDVTRAPRSASLSDRLGQISQPVLVVSGDDDRIVPTEQSVKLSGELPGSRLVIFPACGHVPQEECPQAFLDAVGTFLTEIK